MADKDGRLRKFDRLISVNGQKLKGLTHKDTIQIIKNAGNTISLVVRRRITEENSPPLLSSQPDLLEKDRAHPQVLSHQLQSKGQKVEKPDTQDNSNPPLDETPSSQSGSPEPSTLSPFPPKPSTGPVLPPEPSTPPPSPPKPSTGPVLPPEPSTPPPSPPRPSSGHVLLSEPSIPPPSPPRPSSGHVLLSEPSIPPPSPPRPSSGATHQDERSTVPSTIPALQDGPTTLPAPPPTPPPPPQEVNRPGSLGPVPKGSRQDSCPFEIEVNKTALGLGLTLGMDESGMILVKSLTPRSPITKDGNIR